MFDRALVGHAALMAKIQQDEDFANQLSAYSWQVQAHKITQTDLATASGGNSQARIEQLMRERGSRQGGGPIPETGTYTLHKGEAVLDAMTYERVKRGLRGGAGGGGVNVGSIVINGTNLSQQQLRSAVHGALDDIARKH